MRKNFIIALLLVSTALSACSHDKEWTGSYHTSVKGEEKVETKTFELEEECDEWGKEKLGESDQEDAYECKENSTL